LFSDAQLPENILRRAKARKGGLDQVAADKDAQEQPPLADKVGQADAGQNHGSGKDANGIFHFHKRKSIKVGRPT
jgi:hypothetical protein